MSQVGFFGSGSSSSAFTSINTQIFTSSDTYTPTAGMTFCIIEALGGGGGGAGVEATPGGTVAVGTGGAAGGYARYQTNAATIGASQVVTIGAGGSGGAAGNNPGNDGGTTSVGALVSADGGLGGRNSAAGTTKALIGVSGGAASSPQLSFRGNPAGSAVGDVNTFVMGGSGADSFYGGGGPQIAFVLGGSSGSPATGYGAGGGGAANFELQGSPQPGGDGTSGIVIITEFIA